MIIGLQQNSEIPITIDSFHSFLFSNIINLSFLILVIWINSVLIVNSKI